MKSPLRLSAVLLAVLLPVYPCWSRGAPPAAAERGSSAPASIPQPSSTDVTIPGPLRSFLRMAAISQKAPTDDVLPLLARNVVMEGYSWNGRTPEPNEYLILVKGYLEHARALLSLAGPKGVIRIANCGAAAPLLKVLGYKLREACGPGTSLQTADPKQAFLTIDSGFPLTDLEDALRADKPFVYPITSSQAPVLFKAGDWIAMDTGKRRVRKGKYRDLPHDVLDSLVDDPTLARLYWALARMDMPTGHYLQQKVGLKKLLPFAPVLDFYGSSICIRSGRVVVPGGPAADSAWAHLVKAKPASPSAFILNLLARDNGWMAAYFSALSRISPAQQAYFTGHGRLHSFYEALRGYTPYPGAARPVFRPAPGLVLLTTRLQLEPGGAPHIPGNLAVWKEIVARERKSHSRTVRIWAQRAEGWKRSDQVIAAMFAFSRLNPQNNPLKLFLVLDGIDRRRPADRPLSPGAVRLLADKFAQFGDQYGVFSEFQNLSDDSISRFFNVADSLDRIHDPGLRANAVGIFQANIGLWQILARQGEITDQNGSWDRVLRPFDHVRTSIQLLSAARDSVHALVSSTSGASGFSQQELIALLAGPRQSSPAGQRVRQDLVYRIGSVMLAQRLVSLDTLFALGNGLEQMAHGRPATPGLIHLAGDLQELPMPKPLFTSGERASWNYGLFADSHLQAESETNFTKIIRSSRSVKKLEETRGQLVPFLRDTLVGLNYAYYQPPGAQVLYNDPNFVRSHDFLGEALTGRDQSWKDPIISGRGWTASGGARLEGSLANLPYALAEVEEDFISPQNVQALIWEDMVSTLLMNSVVPRWWRVTPAELHAVALYQDYGDELVEAAAGNPGLRERVMSILAIRMRPRQADSVEQALSAGQQQEALSRLAPADVFFLAAEFRQRFPGEAGKWGKAGQELDSLARHHPGEVSWERLAQDFGTPHPDLAGTYATNLLSVKPFPTFLGYSSRLLAESWQSNNLYWARLADEMGYPPAMLNVLVPQLTHNMIAKIFATDLDDRPALLRALWATGEEFRKSHSASAVSASAASGLPQASSGSKLE
ncbi:MAG TPA: hypothetical protein VFZ08_10525 [Terriglobia bacterium]|nr:hypothetical protein [Terriglobia bacterium]